MMTLCYINGEDLGPHHWLRMAALYWLVFLGSLCIGTVESAGYLGRMPHHGGACYYEDIKDAHFSYYEETCRSKTFLWAYRSINMS